MNTQLDESSHQTAADGKGKQYSFLPWLVGIVIGLVSGLWAANYYFGVGPRVAPPQTQSGAPGLPITSSPYLISPEKGKLGTAVGANTIADIAEAVAPAVVNINTRTSVIVGDMPFHFGLPFGDFQFYMGPGKHGQVPEGLDQIPFGEMPRQRKFEQNGAGSGVIIRSDGYILTNNHVVKNANDIKVTLNDKRIFQGKVVGRDNFTDLALVKIDANNLPVARLGSSKSIRPGDWAIAIGSPMGLDHTVTFGIVSALGRSLSDLNSNVELIQTDAAINPGNSGGPLLNIAGEVIGITLAIRSDAQNIGFAIPIDVARTVADSLLAHGSIQRPYLGIMMQQLDEKLAKSLGLPANSQGVVVAQIMPNSPAAKTELVQGDVIQKVDGIAVSTSTEVQQLVRGHKVGDKLNFLVLRGRGITAVTVTIGEYPDGESN
jgi:S1-C subfamily serine protease